MFINLIFLNKMSRKKLTEKEKKSKINLTINENLLIEIDKLVEKNGLKRSKLIEDLLKKYLKEQ